MKKTTKIILGSALTMALSASLIAGSTLALFSSESKVDVAITAGQVDVKAAIDQSKLKGYSANGSSADYSETEVSGGKFTTGGTYSYDAGSGKLKLENIAPGDGVEFTLNLTNESTINTKYRILITATEDDGGELYKVLQFTFGSEGPATTMTDKETGIHSDWATLENTSKSATATVKVMFPIDGSDQNKYMGKSCELTVSVYAMQANGYVAE